MDDLQEIGYLRLQQIIGRRAVSKEEATKNRRDAERARKRRQKPNTKPKRPRPAIPPVIPVGASTWWEGVKSGRFPKPIRLGPRSTAWPIASIRKLLKDLSK
jgi:hypothetical protein